MTLDGLISARNDWERGFWDGRSFIPFSEYLQMVESFAVMAQSFRRESDVSE